MGSRAARRRSSWAAMGGLRRPRRLPPLLRSRSGVRGGEGARAGGVFARLAGGECGEGWVGGGWLPAMRAAACAGSAVWLPDVLWPTT